MKSKIYFTSFLIILLTSLSLYYFFFWPGIAIDTKLFWNTSCFITNQPANPECALLTTSQSKAAKSVLNTYPYWSHIIFKIISLFSLQALKIWTFLLIILSITITVVKFYSPNNLANKQIIYYLLIAILLIWFVPIRDLFRTGQITWLQLLGLSSFIYLIEQQRQNIRASQYWQLIAGVALGITLIKPHSLYLLYLYIFYLAIFKQRKTLLLGMLIGFLMLNFLSYGLEFWKYIDTLKFNRGYLFSWQQAVLGSIFSKHSISTRLIIMLIGLASILIMHRSKLHPNHLIIFAIIPLSLLTSPYGFSYDLVLLLPTICFLANIEKIQFPLIVLFPLAWLINYLDNFHQANAVSFATTTLILGVVSLADPGLKKFYINEVKD